MSALPVIIIDNNPVPKVPDAIGNLDTSQISLEVVHHKMVGLSSARNTAIEHAATPYIVFIDDDTIPPPNWAGVLLDIIRRQTPDIFGGPVYPYYTDEKPAWFKDEYEIRSHASETGFHADGRVSGGNFGIRVALFDELGRFNTGLGMVGEDIRLGEEREFVERYKAKTPTSLRKIYYDMNFFIRHHVPAYKMRLSYILSRQYAAGKSMARIRDKRISMLPSHLFYFAYFAVTEPASEVLRNGFRNADHVSILGALASRWGNIVQMAKNSFWPQP
jgi:glycosyltransferase involved in cell wall biosynthesis